MPLIRAVELSRGDVIMGHVRWPDELVLQTQISRKDKEKLFVEVENLKTKKVEITWYWTLDKVTIR